jgi:hypothetical protein
MNLANFSRHPVARKLKIRQIREFVLKNYRGIAIVFLAFSLFYWYELRPVSVNRSCAVQASVDARTLLQSKAQVTTDAAKKQSYVSLAERGMYLRTDYESFYKKCLRHYALSYTE